MGIFLTQVGGILKPFAWVLGEILNAIYNFMELFGVHNIAICIILFTLVVKMLMLPITIKQQKNSKLQSRMSPELTKITQKYKGKKDEESLRRQQAETQEVYAKYGTSPMGGCLPLLISLPILFALYRVIYAVPAYVTDIGSLYNAAANEITKVANYQDLIKSFIETNAIAVENNLATYAVGTQEHLNSLIDILAKFNTANWDAFTGMTEFAKVGTITITEAGYEGANVVQSILDANNMFGLSILDSPQLKSFSVIIPILAVVSQWLQSKLSMGTQPQNNQSDTAAGTSKALTTIMPIVSGVFCFMLPIGVGLYWIASAVFQIIQQLIINAYLDKIGIDELIEKAVEKSNKKKAKKGIVTGSNKMTNVARTSTKAIDTSKPVSNTSKEAQSYKRSNVSYSAGSIAANANLLKNYGKEPAKKTEPENKADGANNNQE